jgi:hypothetical protein
MSATKGRRIISSRRGATCCPVAIGQSHGFVDVASHHAKEAFCVADQDSQFLQLADIGVLRYEVAVEAVGSRLSCQASCQALADIARRRRGWPWWWCRGGVFRGFCAAAFYHR